MSGVQGDFHVGRDLTLGNPLGVPYGGLGVNTLADNKLLIGNGAGAVQTNTNLHWDESNGRLGVGTSSPLTTLHVEQSSALNTVLIKNLDAGGDGLTIQLSNDDTPNTGNNFIVFAGNSGNTLTQFEGDNAGGMQISTASQNNAIVCSSSGNIGFSKTTPLYKIDVQDSDASDHIVRINNTNGTTAGGGLLIKTEANGGTSPRDILELRVSDNVNNDLNIGEGPGILFGIPVQGGTDEQAPGGRIKVGRASATEATETANMIFYVNNGSGLVDRGRFDSAGSFTVAALGTGDIEANSGVLSVVSDERLKTINGPYSGALDVIAGINPISFQWNDQEKCGSHVRIGFSAQNIQSVIPEAVVEGPDGYLGLSVRPIIAALVNSVKELKSQIEQLQINA